LAKLPNHFTKYRANKLPLDALTDGQPKNIMPPAPNGGEGTTILSKSYDFLSTYEKNLRKSHDRILRCHIVFLSLP